MRKEYYQDYGVTASIAEHRDGTATLVTYVGGKRTRKKYKSFTSARAAWYRLCQ